MSRSRGGAPDKMPLEFSCPECGRKVKTTAANVRRSAVRCPGGHAIEVDISQLDGAADEVQRKVNKFVRRFNSRRSR